MTLQIRYPVDQQRTGMEIREIKQYLNGVGGSAGDGSVAASLATQVVSFGSATKTLSSADHNTIIDCTAACTVTVPSGLTSGLSGVPFTCGLSKAGTGNVTVAGTVNAPGNLKVLSTQYGLMTLTEFPGGTFRLYGGNV